MESSSHLYGLSFGKTPREGQRRVLDEVASASKPSLNVRLPTGYGKTFTAAAAYSILRLQGRVNRLLYIVPTTAQLNQFAKDGEADLIDAAVTGPTKISNLGYSLKQALLNHRNNRSQTFVCTVQSLLMPNGLECVRDLMQIGQWMLVVDEYHHYGLERSWAKIVGSIPYNFRLAMSATPYRKDQDEAFGKPDIEVLYRDAAEKENAIKRLACHSYVYRIDAVLQDGSIRSFTTPELAEEAASDRPDDIQKLQIERQMRWSPKYVSPLVYNPLDRLEQTRIATGLPCQALVGAMCCSHAQLVCEQIKSMYPYLRVDWVGTGPYGRPDDENDGIIARFCPPKTAGERDPASIGLDVLVHVGKAGEGLDSVFVTEIIHLNPANITNQNNQENGRAARLLPNTPTELQVGYVNVDSCSPYAAYTGARVMDAMDDLPPGKPTDDEDPEKRELGELPEEPKIHILDMSCIKINKGEIARMAGVLQQLVHEWRAADLNNPDHPIHQAAELEYRRMRMAEAEASNSNSVHAQWRDAVERAVNHVVHRAIRLMVTPGARYDKSLPGDLKRRVQRKRHSLFQSYERSDVESLKRQYTWLKEVERAMLESKELPSWLQ